MAEIVREWFQTEGALEEMSRRAKRLGRPEATFNIAVSSRGWRGEGGGKGKGREGKERGAARSEAVNRRAPERRRADP